MQQVEISQPLENYFHGQKLEVDCFARNQLFRFPGNLLCPPDDKFLNVRNRTEKPERLLRVRELNVKISIRGKDGFDLAKLSDAELIELEEITGQIIYRREGN